MTNQISFCSLHDSSKQSQEPPRGYREYVGSRELNPGEWIDSEGWIHYTEIKGRKVFTFDRKDRK